MLKINCDIDILKFFKFENDKIVRIDKQKMHNCQIYQRNTYKIYDFFNIFLVYYINIIQP